MEMEAAPPEMRAFMLTLIAFGANQPVLHVLRKIAVFSSA